MLKLSSDIIRFKNFLINTRTGDSFEVDEKTSRLIDFKAINRTEENSSLLDTMIDNNIIVDTAYDKEKNFFHLQWHLLNACNLRCKHCYDWKNKTQTLNIKQMFKVYDDFVFFVKNVGAQAEISLTGGEPTLFKDLIPLIEYIKSRDVFAQIYILSNGYNLFSDELLECCIKHNVGVQISLDGLEEKHDEIRGTGAFAKSIATIKQLISKGISTTVHCVLMKRNIDGVAEFIRFLDPMGLSRINFSTLIPIGPGAAEAAATPQELKKCMEMIVEMQSTTKARIIGERPLWALVGGSGICPIGDKTLTVDAAGNMMPCRRLPMVMGNVLEDNLLEVWLKNDFLNKMRDKKKNLEKCGTCKFLERCGGCRAMAAAVTGNPLAADPYCWL
ncbi:MAG: radical SAM protein [Alphaproteobacteria bacterium]|nr:radical SAM protein [Alphaproteobacteria bacterium]